MNSIAVRCESLNGNPVEIGSGPAAVTGTKSTMSHWATGKGVESRMILSQNTSLMREGKRYAIYRFAG